MTMTSEILEKLVRKENLSVEEARAVMDSIMSGQLSDARIAAVLTALRMKGETVEEIAGFASAMAEKAIRISPRRNGLVDTCGTGGDDSQTFNISTATALVTASMGIPVAKHGNRAVSSKCGSADVLEALGVNIQLPPERVAELIDRVGIGFLFAPRHHPAMKHAAAVRKQLGIRTVFNVLGPLTNPAGVRRQLIGVFHRDLTEVLCRVLDVLGLEKAFVVHGLDGIDEVSIAGETVVSGLEGGRVRTFRFTPEEAGLGRANLSEITGGSAEENAAWISSILSGGNGARTDAVLLNAGFVALLADRASDVREGVRMAREAIESGRARALLENLREISHSLAKEEA
jgi:anthranilate phosphoribosyltransferase